MLSFTRPTDAAAEQFLRRRRDQSFSYASHWVGATREGDTPPGYAIAHYRAQLGLGEQTFERAKLAICQWRMFPAELVHLYPERPDVAVGGDVALRIRAAAAWSLAACRIVYTLDDTACQGNSTIRRFGFAYGTLPGHVEQGEERFLVEWNQNDNRVTYDLLAFSRLDAPLAWLGMPVARYYERRFAYLSCRAMRVACRAET